mmetsp:Transcript_14165/g.31280  ORF Transcript_14165/g.31280 Transcript_14165/m.31280 type:complete len:339 (-) Transcript_14165:514-1530(-)
MKPPWLCRRSISLSDIIVFSTTAASLLARSFLLASTCCLCCCSSMDRMSARTFSALQMAAWVGFPSGIFIFNSLSMCLCPATSFFLAASSARCCLSARCCSLRAAYIAVRTSIPVLLRNDCPFNAPALVETPVFAASILLSRISCIRSFSRSSFRSHNFCCRSSLAATVAGSCALNSPTSASMGGGLRLRWFSMPLGRVDILAISCFRRSMRSRRLVSSICWISLHASWFLVTIAILCLLASILALRIIFSFKSTSHCFCLSFSSLALLTSSDTCWWCIMLENSLPLREARRCLSFMRCSRPSSSSFLLRSCWSSKRRFWMYLSASASRLAETMRVPE